jgi:SAM-dependent methyltransferase
VTPEPDITESMRDYYAQRAAYYERVYFKPERQDDLRAIEAWLPAQFAGRRVLEIACGTGWWTQHGARDALSWLATDLNPETLAVARSKPMPPSVRLARLDAYTFAELHELTLGAAAAPGAAPFDAAGAEGRRPFDAAFAGCWWSHVPLARLPGWLNLLHGQLQSGARVVMLDNRFVPTSSTPLSRRDEAGNTYQQRPLDDGSTHEVLKNFPTPEEALALLGPRAQDAQWVAYPHYWVLSYTLK